MSANAIPVTGITLDPTTLSLTEGETKTITATIEPENASDKTVTWTSSDPEIATVDENGSVTAVKEGNATITASTANGLTATCAVSVNSKIIEVTGITIVPSTLTLPEGETRTLTATLQPENASDKNVTWTSSDPEIASVDQEGNVTAVKEGVAIITATSSNGKTATCTVTVSANFIKVTGISLTPTSATLKVGEELVVTYTIIPANSSDQNVTWTSSNPEVATVDENGNVTAKSIGFTTITATCGDQSGICAVNVVRTPVTGFTISPQSATLKVGENFNIEYTVIPEDATDKTITWTSDKPAIASVDADGKVTALAIGEAIITAACDGLTQTCIVTVEPVPATEIKIDPSSATMKVGETLTISYTVLPEDATDKSVVWTSSNSNVASVDENGNVTALELGTTTITATCGNATATCTITVVATPAESITLDPTFASMKVADHLKISATISPADATDKTIKWTSSNTEIAIVDAEGNVTAIAIGEADITASCGNATASCAITVVPTLAEVITVDPSFAELKVGETVQLTPTITPESTTDKKVTWSSNNESVAVVDESGLVTAVGLGSTSITATCGNIYTTATISVVPTPATGLILNPKTAELKVGESIMVSATVEPATTTDSTVVWMSEDDKIASVDANGIITALSVGVVKIKAICGDVTAYCEVTVVPTPAERIEITPNPAEIKINETLSLTAIVIPESATQKNVTWASSDESIVTVNASGTITGIAAGEAIITATNGEVSADCKVTVVPNPVSSITLTNSELTMDVGETAEIDAIAHPSDAEVENIIWTSEDESIATVNERGVVTAVAVGHTTITATYMEDPSIKAECKVTVRSNIITVSEIIISDKTLEMIVDDKYTLTATVLPENATDQSLTWRSSDWAVATVAENGEVTATGVGTATIYVSSSNGLTEQCLVTVRERIIDPTGISLSNTELLMREGHSTDLIAIVRPDNASDKSVTWATSDPEIAIVDENGIVTAIKQGNAIISATTVNGLTAECYVTVVPVIVAVEDLSISDTSIILNINETYTLIATVSPEDATDKTITWRSSDPSIATVNEYGVVTGIAEGSAIIYASSSNGLTVECHVTVLPGEIEVTGISLSNTELLMREGYTADLIAIIHPDNASDKTVFWSTSDPEIATVDQNGIVTAIKQGFCTITATSAYGQQATCAVTVVPVVNTVEQIIISETAIEISIDETYQLSATIIPDDATDKTITWRSSDPSIATVDQNGLVTGVSAGSVFVYASSSNGLTAECKVTVTPGEIDVISISLTNTELLMVEGDTTNIIAIVRPDDATDKTVIWTSSDESVATVDQNGNITAVKMGHAVITATAVNGVSANCYVTVVPRVVAVENIIISDTTLVMNIADVYTLTAKVIPENASDQTLTWKSSDTSIVTVSENGEVTAISAGTAIIYVSTSNGLTATCKVTVLPGEIPVLSISLSNTELLMREGYSTELIAIVHPENATDKRVVWSTSDPNVAIVDSNGNVTATGVGTAIITVTSVYDPTVKNQCVVTVEREVDIVAVTDITLNRYEITLVEGDTFDLIATISPDDATDKNVTWKSSDLAISTVSENGVVTAISRGTAIIYASSSNGLTAECKVTVIPVTVDPTSITLTNTELLMREGHTADLIAIVGPENATDKSVTWSSSDESIATVDQNGLVTAIKQGVTIITAATCNGIEAYCKVTVIPVVIPVESITLNKYTLEMEVEETFDLIATVMPEDATDKSVTWKSSDKAIATVSDNGMVTAISPGTAIIYASSSNGLTAECVVTVTPGIIEVTGISLTNTELLMIEGDVSDLIAIVHPDNATDKTVVWASSDEAIATVDQNGIVTAIKTGYTIVSATANNGIKAECFVTVMPRIIAVESISISDSELELIVGDTYTLTAEILPEDATDKTVTWKSSDLAIATVSENGLVTALQVGTAIIYASSSNGLTAECHLTVKPGIIEVERVDLTNSELLMREGYTAELYAIVLPENATDKTLVWSSTNEEIATVDQNGVVTAIKQGHTIVSATANNGVKDTCFVTVVPVIIAVEGINVDRTELTLIEGDNYQLTATVTPEDATDKTITWKSSDRSVATVSENGLVDAIKVGTATIYVSSSNGLTVECAVTVLPRIIEVANISLSPTSLSLAEGETAALAATVEPTDATDKTLTWTSADPGVAVVVNGIVTGIKEGSTVITVESSNGLKAECNVTVYARPLTPKQLLKKGDGTTSTFVIMMDISDAELDELGYRFVVGYTDTNGESTVIAETPLRYCHTSAEIYNDPSYDFWAFSIIENKEGELLNSNLRHLDGREEVCFNASNFGYATKGSGAKEIESEEWIKITSNSLLISPDMHDEVHVAVYTLTGTEMYSKSYKASEAGEIELDRFTPGMYLIAVRSGRKMISKTIVVR